MGAVASAPGKVILFGEHAVVYGEPAVSVAIAKRLSVRLAETGSSPVMGGRMHSDRYTEAAFRRQGAAPRRVEVVSEIPSGCGLGSSAALCTAVNGALFADSGSPAEKAQVAEAAFRTELEAQGRASPIDTSTATLGGGLRLARAKGVGHRWSIKRDDVEWHVHSVGIGELPLVIGNTGRPAATGEMVAQVRQRWERDDGVRQAVRRIGEVADAAVPFLAARDLRSLGELMDENESLLRRIGVGHASCERLIAAVRPLSLGAKITGAGGGGSIIALTERPDEAVAALLAAGAKDAFRLSIDTDGLKVDRSR